MYLSDNFFI